VIAMTDPAVPAATLVTAPAGADASLVLRIRAGRAELGQAALVRGRARELLRELGPDADEATVARWLLAHGAPDERGARAGARRFLGELGALQADGAAAPTPEPSDAREPRTPPDCARAELDAAAWTGLARAVLAAGHRLRFRAHGRSMRPLVPHGSLLEVEARAFERVRLGEVVLHASPRAPLVAHRVVGRAADALVTRGDSNARLERVPARDVLGVVVARESGGRWRAVSSGPARWLGLAAGLAYRGLVGLVRVLVLRPLRTTFGGRSRLRAGLRGVLRGASRALVVLERAAIRLRRPLDTLTAALLSSAEKDADRARLYRRRAIQDFTAQAENVRSGLTLLEEVLLARHPLPPGDALVLGCGPGRECLALARRGWRVTGLDREPGMLAHAEAYARDAGLDLRTVTGEAADFALADAAFDAVVIFSGLYDMLLPGARRVGMLRCARAHLRPGGHVLVTFLAAYRWPGEPPRAHGASFLEALNPEHEAGDTYLLNEAIHVFPEDADVAAEARLAGLETVELFRDQRAYDRPAGQVRGYAVLRRPAT
jgi:SAM-dependent methyltransferase